jgi:hypothetical protein
MHCLHSADEPNRANDQDEDDRQHHSVFRNILTLVVGQEPRRFLQ